MYRRERPSTGTPAMSARTVTRWATLHSLAHAERIKGWRSAAGEATLKKMGYRNVFNLGSYGRAEKILSE
jgi:hypothetical protein